MSTLLKVCIQKLLRLLRDKIMKFSDFMITKDNPGEVIDDEILKDRILYIPRVNSGNGKKRGAILSWALPANRM
jgi:hypothetical protein